MKVNLTQHSKDRIKERLGLPKRALKRHVKLVLRRGMRTDQLNGSLLSYVSWCVRKHRYKCNNPIVHGHHLYIFHDRTLITVMELPTDLKSLADQLSSQADGEEEKVNRQAT